MPYESALYDTITEPSFDASRPTIKFVQAIPANVAMQKAHAVIKNLLFIYYFLHYRGGDCESPP